jgi:Icc-related predicted phosphoesterase
MKFDLISDLHNNFWPTQNHVNWEGIGTSLLAIVLGDVSTDPNETYKTVVDISKYYKYVIFIDGNHEHNNQCGIQEHNQLIKNQFAKYHNIQYLNRSAIVIDGVAFVGANGWWTFDFMEPTISREEAYWYFASNFIFSEPFMQELLETAREDAMVLCDIVSKLTVDTAVSEIVMLTHTAPFNKFNDVQQPQHPAHYSRCGNSYLGNVLDFDINKKIKTWCFGHVHQEFDQTINNVRYICHPRGRLNDSPHNLFYYPKLIDTFKDLALT